MLYQSGAAKSLPTAREYRKVDEELQDHITTNDANS
jgi:hypothetical protein